ncbi:MAG: hypothetical protein CMP07_02865 [Xanthomonadales bacterium]|nr:hypothetical protein [Xanthomonadales bacterium]
MFMDRAVLAGLSLLLFTACSTSPSTSVEPEFNAPLVNVSLDESSNYWTLDRRSQVDARRAIGAPATSYECRRAVLAYTVDSNGSVFDVEIVDAWPNEAAARYFAAMQGQFRYDPTATNPDRIPIRTIGTQTAFVRGADCEFPPMKGLSWPDE